MDIYIKINEFLVRNWFNEFINNKLQASYEFNIDEKIVRKLFKYKENNYKMPIKTLKSICDAKGIKLSDFFQLIEE